ncbi:FAD-binding oxidoreductase [Mesorhizobium sp. M0659]|uniref:NAD(P)/FAD-dependent oxidoreductase n=1 Tax=Mesorhizobium sp. M0659 TaxID=2956980 RepID=UPI0033379EA2
MTSAAVPSNALPSRFDVVVVGGGLLGCAVSYYLAGDGLNVLLAERDQINRQASGQNAGSLHFQLEYRMIEHGEAQARKAAEAMPLHLDAQHRWALVESELGADLGVVQSGGLMVAEEAPDIAKLEKKVAIEREAGLTVDLLDRGAVRSTAPYLSDKIKAAAYCRSEGKADPRRCALAFASAAQAKGATIRSRLGVASVSRVRSHWLVCFDDGTSCTTRAIVIAAGAWSGQVAAMLGVQIPSMPHGLMMTVTAKTEPVIRHLVQHVGKRLSLKQNGSGNIVIGGGWPAAMVMRDGQIDLNFKPIPLLTSISGNMAAAIGVVPGLINLPVLRVWTGTTSAIPDQLPMIGNLAGCSDCYIATGGSAFTLGPTYARILADRVLGRPDKFNIAAYSPSRFTGGAP